RQPDRVLTDSQWQAIHAAARGDGPSTVNNFYPRTLDMTVRDLELLQRKQDPSARIGRPREMPLLAGRPSAPPPVEVPAARHATPRFIAPDGTEWPLTNEAIGWFTLADGVSGLDVTPYDLTKDPYPRGGSRLRHRQPAERTIIWPLHVFGDDHTEFIERWRALGTALASTLHDGPGWLEIARPDGSRRRIAVIYEDGFEGQGQQGTYII